MSIAHAMKRAGVLALMLAAAGCADPLSPERDFLIRTPARRTTAAVPVIIQASASATGTTLFEWTPAEGAQSYTITFWQGDSEAQVERLEADFSQPLISFDVTSPEITEQPLNPGRPDDPRRIMLVRHEIPLSQIAEALASAGIEADGARTYTLLSVFARSGSSEWRSSSLTPIILQLNP